jgi:hypothetical protein
MSRVGATAVTAVAAIATGRLGGDGRWRDIARIDGLGLGSRASDSLL